jgi:hypothetical protein
MLRKLLLVATLSAAGSTVGVGSAAAQTETTFCNAALEVDRASGALAEGKPKQAEIDRADAALTALEGTAPPEVASNVSSLAATIRDALADEEDPAADPTFQEDLKAINAYRYSSCGYQTADVTLLEYEFDGLPKSFTTGTVAIKLTNTGTEVHELALARLKSDDPFKKSLGLPQQEQRKKLRYVAQSLVPPDETTYLFVELTRAGRYGAVCHIPVGTTSVEDLESDEDVHGHGGESEPHWREGMTATFTVTAA